MLRRAQRTSDAIRMLEVSSNDYFFFFLSVFLTVFFAFFAFLAMLPTIIPKVISMQADHRHACIQSTPQY